MRKRLVLQTLIDATHRSSISMACKQISRLKKSVTVQSRVLHIANNLRFDIESDSPSHVFILTALEHIYIYIYSCHLKPHYRYWRQASSIAKHHLNIHLYHHISRKRTQAHRYVNTSHGLLLERSSYYSQKQDTYYWLRTVFFRLVGSLYIFPFLFFISSRLRLHNTTPSPSPQAYCTTTPQDGV